MSVVDSTIGATIDLNEVYAFLLEVVTRAGRVVSDAFYKEKKSSLKISFADIVTETDTAVERLLIDALSAQYPTHKFIGEESTTKKVEFTDRPVWIIDPVDGTTNFVHQMPHCAISIALYVNKQAQIGVVFNPIRDELFSAIRGQGAYCNGRTISHSGQTEINKSQVIAEFGSSREDDELGVKIGTMQRIIKQAHSIRSLGAAAPNICYVANGSCDAYFEHGLHIWDIAAAALIAREAGCVVQDPDTGSADLDITQRKVLVTSTTQLANQLRPLIKPVAYESD